MKLRNIDRALVSFCFQEVQKQIDAGKLKPMIVSPEEFSAWRVYFFDRVMLEPHDSEKGLHDGLEESIAYNEFVKTTGFQPELAIKKWMEMGNEV
jgi:hypothetical protein